MLSVPLRSLYLNSHAQKVVSDDEERRYTHDPGHSLARHEKRRGHESGFLLLRQIGQALRRRVVLPGLALLPGYDNRRTGVGWDSTAGGLQTRIARFFCSKSSMNTRSSAIGTPSNIY
jgi:hypothetical protein